MSLHATEIGGSQMAPELAYDLVSRQDEEARRILENVVSIMVLSFNPGRQIITGSYGARIFLPPYGSRRVLWQPLSFGVN